MSQPAYNYELTDALTEQARRVPAEAVHVDPALVRIAILAGGKGARLAPYTSVLPKPLMPVGDRAILEIVLEQLALAGFRRVTLCVGYLSHLIRAVVDNGGRHGIDVSYVQELDPIGTAGPLRLIENTNETFIAMNGDILTTLDYADLLRTHRASGNMLTIATHVRTVSVDYGVLHLADTGEPIAGVNRYVEKPEFNMAVSMGIYAVEPEALKYIPEDGYFDFPDLVKALLRDRQPVGAYRFDGYWLDIGRHEDYAEATKAWESAEHSFLPA
jgi:NDP-mannose synthase